MKILITGGTGFIGSHTAAALASAGHELRMLVRSKEKMDRVMDYHGITIKDYVIGDVTDPLVTRQALTGCDGVFHSAAMVSTSSKDADKVTATNVNGTRNVIGQAVELGLSHIIHVSSITAIFNPAASKVDESSPVGTASNAYGRSKVVSEKYVRQLQANGEPVIITYPTGVIGPGDPALTEPLQGLALILSTLALMTTTGLQYVDVRDLADVHCKLFAGPSAPNRFMLGGHYYPWAYLVGELEAITGRELLKFYMPKPAMKAMGMAYGFINRIVNFKSSVPIDSESMTYATQWVYADSTKLEQELDFKFRDARQSMIESLLWLVESGQLDKKLIGKLQHYSASH